MDLMSTEVTDREIAATILDKLARKKKWGAAHISSDKISRWISRKVKRNGKRVRKVLKDLIKKGMFVLRLPSMDLKSLLILKSRGK